MLTNKTQKLTMPTVISVLGIPKNGDKAIAEAINLLTVSQGRPPINPQELPANQSLGYVQCSLKIFSQEISRP